MEEVRWTSYIKITMVGNNKEEKHLFGEWKNYCITNCIANQLRSLPRVPSSFEFSLIMYNTYFCECYTNYHSYFQNLFLNKKPKTCLY